MDRQEFVFRRMEDAVVFEGMLRDMLELDMSDVPKEEVKKVLNYFKEIM